ncbi:acetate uptake transporter [Brevibacterium marinum]|uniref:Uncharacterized protein n=1 Tax=Brevibacterium marinum TaxID=418643 RepID=A0A846RRG8_9MICO|nr:acetate uptake transporter [Brevibacterium marinum]NJC56614.1 hypothetical protein [Brevibacterium marinum]
MTDVRVTEPAPIATRLADPLPLGIGAFALTTFVLSMFNAGLLDAAAEPAVFGLALAYGGIAQFGAGIWEFARGNTFGATAFCSFGAFWISFWWLTGFAELPEEAASAGLGIYLLAWGIFTLYMIIPAIKVNTTVLIVFILLAITFFLLSIGEFAQNVTVGHLGGYAGLATALVAWYASFAGVTNETFGRQVIPMG